MKLGVIFILTRKWEFKMIEPIKHGDLTLKTSEFWFAADFAVVSDKLTNPLAFCKSSILGTIPKIITLKSWFFDEHMWAPDISNYMANYWENGMVYHQNDPEIFVFHDPSAISCDRWSLLCNYQRREAHGLFWWVEHCDVVCVLTDEIDFGPSCNIC